MLISKQRIIPMKTNSVSMVDGDPRLPIWQRAATAPKKKVGYDAMFGNRLLHHKI